MPHLHLPVDHTDADLVLAANLAEIVGSEDLYVAWSHESGPGAIPEVEAVLVVVRVQVGERARHVAQRLAVVALGRRQPGVHGRAVERTCGGVAHLEVTPLGRPKALAGVRPPPLRLP